MNIRATQDFPWKDALKFPLGCMVMARMTLYGGFTNKTRLWTFKVKPDVGCYFHRD